MPDRFAYVKRGYDPVVVDEYIDTLEGIIKGYKDKDASIKNAILNAQIAADGIIKNARIHSREMRGYSYTWIENLSNSIGKQKSLLSEFQNEYNQLIEKYLLSVNNTEFSEIHNKLDAFEDYLAKFKEDKFDENSSTAE